MDFKDVENLDPEYRALTKQRRDIEEKIKEYQDKCPHDKGVFGPLYHKTKSGQMMKGAGPREASCSRCTKTVGRWCEKSPTHICEYDHPDKQAYDYHDACIHCGKLWEDG